MLAANPPAVIWPHSTSAMTKFSDWSSRDLHTGEKFIMDGIIDPIRWQSAPVKVLFLLKEAYQDEEKPTGYDLRKVLLDEWKGPKYTIWWRVARWAYLIQGFRDRSKQDYPKDETGLKEALLSSAIINLRKSGGQRRSNAEVLRQYVEIDFDLLQAQIEETNADVVVCGGTWQLAKDLWPERKYISNRLFQSGSSLIVDYWHPAVQWHSELLYFGLAGFLGKHFS